MGCPWEQGLCAEYLFIEYTGHLEGHSMDYSVAF